MKKTLFLGVISLLIVLVNTAYAQNDKFNAFVANFTETRSPTVIQSTDIPLKIIDQQLAWEFTWQKNKFKKPEKCFVVPFGYYRLTLTTAVIISAVTEEVGANNTYTLIVQTYNTKKGKLINEQGGVLGAFSDYLKMSSQVEINTRGGFTITSKDGDGKDVVNILIISYSGKIKVLK
jgi:hypothetical protein